MNAKRAPVFRGSPARGYMRCSGGSLSPTLSEWRQVAAATETPGRQRPARKAVGVTPRRLRKVVQKPPSLEKPQLKAICLMESLVLSR